MARSSSIDFTVHNLAEDDFPSRGKPKYREVISKIAKTGKDKYIQCHSLGDTEAVYQGIKRAVGNHADPTKFDLAMSTKEHRVYIRLV